MVCEVVSIVCACVVLFLCHLQKCTNKHSIEDAPAFLGLLQHAWHELFVPNKPFWSRVALICVQSAYEETCSACLPEGGAEDRGLGVGQPPVETRHRGACHSVSEWGAHFLPSVCTGLSP